MLGRHISLRRNLDRWGLAVARSLTPRTRIVARSVQNRVRPPRLVAQSDGEHEVAVDVWAETRDLADRLLGALTAGGVDAYRTWLGGEAVVVEADQAAQAIEVLQSQPEAATWWVRGPRRRYRPLSEVTAGPRVGRWRVRVDRGGSTAQGLTGQGVGVILQFAGHEAHATEHLPLRHTDLPHLLRITEPIDVVYTWVDDTDPDWQRQRAATVPGDELAIDALSASRTVDHGELRYSLRSLASFAGWVRHVWIVTSGQVPTWLDVDHPKVTVVPHRAIFTDQAALPTFNSHAIESQLHHIDGLAEHFLYLNDDVFFGRPVAPELFFHGNGIAKFMTSDLTIDVDSDDTPRNGAAAAARHNRDLIERVWHRTVTHRMKHVPHAHRRSSLAELEAREPELFARVARSRFRSTDDVSVASDLGHYHAYAQGLAAPGTLAFRYVDLTTPSLGRYLDDLLARRAFDVFCLNDADSDQSTDQDGVVADFLQRYFPAPSPFERAW